jgi:hypothetical protein
LPWRAVRDYVPSCSIYGSDFCSFFDSKHNNQIFQKHLFPIDKFILQSPSDAKNVIFIMTLEELQTKLIDINHLVVTFQTSVAFEKYYAENIVMIEGDGTVTTGKEACRQGREFFFEKMLVEFRESKLISQNIAVSAEQAYDFVVVSNWYNDFTINFNGQVIDNKSNQLSIGYWKDGLVVKESYNYPVISLI